MKQFKLFLKEDEKEIVVSKAWHIDYLGDGEHQYMIYVHEKGKSPFDGHPVYGWCELRKLPDEVIIWHIEMKKYKGQGYGKKMIQQVFDQFPDDTIKLTSLTDSGQEFFQQYDYHVDENGDNILRD